MHLIIINLCPGQYNTKPSQSLNCNTTVNVWVAGFCRIQPGKGTAALFCPVQFLEEFWPVGGFMSHSQIATGGLNLIGPPHQIIQTYNNQPLGGWALAELAGGWKGGSVLWPAKFNKNSTFGGGGGGVSQSQIASSRLNSFSAAHQNIQTYHNQPLGGWVLAESAGGWKDGSVLWP